MSAKRSIPTFVSLRLQVPLTWLRTSRILAGHGVSFLHDAYPECEVAYIEGYLRGLVDGGIQVQIVTAKPRDQRLLSRPASISESDVAPEWAEVVAEVREAVVAYIEADEPRPKRFGRVSVWIGG